MRTKITEQQYALYKSYLANEKGFFFSFLLSTVKSLLYTPGDRTFILMYLYFQNYVYCEYKKLFCI